MVMWRVSLIPCWWRLSNTCFLLLNFLFLLSWLLRWTDFWSNMVWISNKLNARWTFKHCISQLASLIETILTRRVERSVYCKFMVLLFILAASYGGRGSTCSQDSGSGTGHFWFVVQIGATRRSSQREYITISSITYPSQKKKAQIPREIWSVQFWKKWPCGIKRTNGRGHTNAIYCSSSKDYVWRQGVFRLTARVAA